MNIPGWEKQRVILKGAGMILDIKLKGYNGHGHKVCDNCPCFHITEFGVKCGVGFYDHTDMDDSVLSNGYINMDTGETQIDDGGKGWYSVYIRPRACIDAHG